MSKAYSDYHETFMAETTAILNQIRGVLAGTITADEFNQQSDQHFANMDVAYQRYLQDKNQRKIKR